MSLIDKQEIVSLSFIKCKLEPFFSNSFHCNPNYLPHWVDHEPHRLVGTGLAFIRPSSLYFHLL